MKRSILLVVFLSLPLTTLAQSTLINIPGLSGANDFNTYVNAVYAMFISLAALLAVVKIIVAGVKYMFSDIATQKSDAKKDIRGALIGLVIVLAAVLILTVINPDLTNFDGGNLQRRVIQPPSPVTSINNTIAAGGTVIGLNSGDTQADCENIDLSQCSTGTQLSCYAGTFTPVGSQNVCVISPYNNVFQDDTILCESTQQCQTGPGGCGDRTYDCSSAQQRCIDAGYGYRQNTIAGINDRSQVVCVRQQDSGSGTPNQNSQPLTIDISAGNTGQDIPLANLSSFDPTTNYTVYDPADASLGLSQGPNHGQPLTIIGPQRGNMIVVQTANGNQTFTGCATISPSVCN